MNFRERLRFFCNNFLHLLAMNVPYGRLNRALYRMRGTKVGENVNITHGVFLEESYPELITIEDNVHIGPGAIVVTHDSSYKCADSNLPVICKPVHVRKNAYIGAGAIILPGVTVGEYAIVAAGSLVTKDVQERTIVKGIPARVVGSTDERIRKFLESASHVSGKDSQGN